jgi:hypothetical protein
MTEEHKVYVGNVDQFTPGNYLSFPHSIYQYIIPIPLVLFSSLFLNQHLI